MYLTRLLYFSRASQGLGMDLDQILASAREQNSKNNITGALWFDGDYFVQVLEGGRHAVSETYHRIAADERHTDIELASCEMVDSRLFHKWRMAYFADTQENRDLITKYSGHNQLIPEKMSARSLLHVLAEGQLLGH
ncbi:BLUF domain-containing protein [Maricaulis sp.]|uniref:BLUF domain-containing protein n=1 Tax=unclassified Maricaulis TaxID=2632371 RepID=UPI001AFDF4CE|nr:BLUF domain-containing protein [Maricaulis sp.]MBO6797870.1 BLUF domain-containing protein [Maricaulis sp.]